MADYSGKYVTFLDQEIKVGSFTGRPTGRCAIREYSTALDLYRVCKDIIGLYDEEENLKTEDFLYLQDSNGVNKFAIGFRKGGFKNSYIDNDHYFICWKCASENITITDNDKPPAAAPWNDWHWAGEAMYFNGYIANWPGIAPSIWPDLASAGLTPTQLAEILGYSSISFFAPDPGLYPYWQGPSYGDATLTQIFGYMDSCFVIMESELKNYDGTSVVSYTGETPISYHGGTAWTNMITDYDCTDPSYTIGGTVGYGADYDGFCPFDLLPYNPEEPLPDEPESPGAGGGTYVPGGWGGYTGYNNTFPSKSVIDTGLISIYSPSDAQVEDLAEYLWTDDYYASLQKWGLKPTEQIITFGYVPFEVPRDGTASDVYMCGQNSNVQMYKVTSQYYGFNAGSVLVRGANFDNLGAFADYQRSKVLMYIPCIGFVPLVATDVLDHYINLRYRVDLFTGNFVADVYREDGSKPTLIGSYSGNCLTSFPLTEANYAQFYQQKRGTIFGMIGDIVGGITEAITNPASLANIGDTIASLWDGVDNLTKLAPEVQRSGSMDESFGALAFEQPFIMLVTPNMFGGGSEYVRHYGRATMNAYKLSDLTGLTIVARVIDGDVAATDEEKNEINALLKDGVIL